MKKRFTEERIVRILQEAERTRTDQEIIRKYNIFDTTFYRRKKLYGGMGSVYHLIETLSRLMTLYGRPQFIRSDNGPEFTANALKEWLKEHEVGPSFIDPGSPWQNAYVESFNGEFRDE